MTSEKDDLLYNGTCQGRIVDARLRDDIAYIIVCYRQQHPCAYIGVDKGHPWWGERYTDIDLDVHGGCTYSDFQVLGIEDDRYWFGWDYAHGGDYDNQAQIQPDYHHKWTLSEIYDDVFRACEQAREVLKE